jgi:hypothetical protein
VVRTIRASVLGAVGSRLPRAAAADVLRPKVQMEPAQVPELTSALLW